MQEGKKERSTEQILMARRDEFKSIRDKAEGAIQAIEIAINDLRRAANEQQSEAEKVEEAGNEQPAGTNGSGKPAEFSS